MNYYIIFDIAHRDAQPWFFGAYGFLFIAVGVALIAIVRRHGKIPFSDWSPERSTVFAYACFGFSLFWTIAVFSALIFEYSNLTSALSDGRAKVVEGIVENFHPMPASGHDSERFCVEGVCFSYSDFGITFGFNNTSSHGGPIKSGLRVRVTHLHNSILKLEIAQ